MNFFSLYMDPYDLYNFAYVGIIIVFFFSLWAQFNVQSTYNKFAKKASSRGVTGAEAARRILSSNGIYDVSVTKIGGNLSDHYDPKAKVIRLSENVYESSSIAAIGVACHEAGHAVQYANDYLPVKIRMSMAPALKYCPTAWLILFMIGIFFSIPTLSLVGIVLFSAIVLFQLITLPVEFDASRRAILAIEGSRMLDEREINGAKKVLSAAALTYVAALATSLMQLLRLIAIFSGNSRNRR